MSALFCGGPTRASVGLAGGLFSSLFGVPFRVAVAIAFMARTRTGKPQHHRPPNLFRLVTGKLFKRVEQDSVWWGGGGGGLFAHDAEHALTQFLVAVCLEETPRPFNHSLEPLADSSPDRCCRTFAGYC